MKKWLKWSLWGVFLLFVAVYTVYAKTQPLKAELIEIQPQTIAKTFSEEGKVISRDERDFYSSLAGRITSLPVEEGKLVKQGELLWRVDTEDLNYQLKQLKGQLTSLQGQEKQAFKEPYSSQIAAQKLALEQAGIQLEAANKNLNRVSSLYQEGAVSQDVFEEAEKAVKQARNLYSQQEQALNLIVEQQNPPKGTKEQFAGLRASLKAQIALLEYQKSMGIIYSPMNGKIKSVAVKEGMVVAPGTLLFTLFQPDQYEMEVFLLTEDIIYAKPGMKVKVIQESKAGDLAFAGEVTKIAPAAQEKVSPLGLIEQRVKVTVKINGDIKNLLPGYSLDVEFTTHRESDKLAVPKTVLFPYNGKDALWVVREGRAVIQSVKKGFETDEYAVIEQGLKAGDQVIRNPQLEGLKEDKRVIENR